MGHTSRGVKCDVVEAGDLADACSGQTWVRSPAHRCRAKLFMRATPSGVAGRPVASLEDCGDSRAWR